MTTGQGGLTRVNQRRMRIMASAQALWLAVVLALGGWWTQLVLRQAGRIGQLENATGLNASIVQDHLSRTQRMIYWEGGSFLALLIASSTLLIGLYRREAGRTRGLHAFFASVTHELRTPLTSIRLQAESIAENLGPDFGEAKLVSRLLEDTLRLEAQVERTLELARVEGGGPVYAQPLQLKSWIERALVNWSLGFGDRVRFQSRIEDIWIEADPAALEVILKNLLENSVRHSKLERVDIRLETETTTHGEVLIHVRDNGEGFKGDPRFLGRLFERGPNSQGAGVGLYLVQILMKKMGGRAEFSIRSGFETVLGFPVLRDHG